MARAASATVDAYLETLPDHSRKVMEQIRQRLRAAAPDAIEGIKYGMPTAKLAGTSIIYYAAWKSHVALYPVYRGEPGFEAALAPYRDKKDTVRFDLDKPLPDEIIDLILSAQLARAGGTMSAGGA